MTINFFEIKKNQREHFLGNSQSHLQVLTMYQTQPAESNLVHQNNHWVGRNKICKHSRFCTSYFHPGSNHLRQLGFSLLIWLVLLLSLVTGWQRSTSLHDKSWKEPKCETFLRYNWNLKKNETNREKSYLML